MSKLKLLRICHKFLVDEDGYDLHVQDLVDSLKNEYDNYLIFFISKGELKNYIKKNKLIKKNGFYYNKNLNVKIIPLIYIKKYGDYIRDLFYFKNIKSLNKQIYNNIKKINPDIVHIHGTLVPQFLTSVFIAGRFSKRVISTHHIGLINKNYENQKYSILFLKYFIHNLFPFICDKVICVSNYGKDSFLFKKNMIVINPIPRLRSYSKEKFMNIIKNNLIKNKFKIKKKDKIYFYPARISKQKNQLNLVKAFEKMDKSSKLILVGKIDRGYFLEITNLISKYKYKNNFCILNKLPQDKIMTIYNKIDYVVMPSFNEGFGRVPMEALQFNKPIMVSNAGGFKENIKERGVVVDPYDIKSIFDGLIKIKKITKLNSILNYNKYVNKINKIYKF